MEWFLDVDFRKAQSSKVDSRYIPYSNLHRQSITIYENKLPKIEGIESIGSYLDSVVSLSKIDFQCLSLLNVDFFPFLNYISNGDTPNIIGCCYKIDYVIYFIFTLKVLFKSCYKNCSEFSDGKLIPNKIGPVYKYLYNMAWCVTKMRGPPLR